MTRGSGPVILLTGAGGQLGRELRRDLAPLGEVHALDRQSLDLTDIHAIRSVVRALRPSLIVNAAAYTAVDAAESDAVTARAVNATAPALLAELGREFGAAMIHFSTDYVFDGTATTAYTERDEPNPRTVYGQTKLAGEQAVGEAGLPHLILRSSWVFGLHGRNFLRTMLRLLAERTTIDVVDDQRGAPTWSRALSSATAGLVKGWAGGALVDRMAGVSGVYHLAAPDCTTWYGFACAIQEEARARGAQLACEIRPIMSDAYPSAASRPAFSHLDSGTARTILGVELLPWREQLRRCLADNPDY